MKAKTGCQWVKVHEVLAWGKAVRTNGHLVLPQTAIRQSGTLGVSGSVGRTELRIFKWRSCRIRIMNEFNVEHLGMKKTIQWMESGGTKYGSVEDPCQA